MSKRGFTLLEIMVTMAFVAVMIGPVLSAFQVSERMSLRSRRAFNAQTLARDMMAEISGKAFDDPQGADTYSVALLPGPTHEEYVPAAPTLPNGTDETGVARRFNATLLDRRANYDDLDDYDGYNADGKLQPTDASGREFLSAGDNLYRDFRVKVKVAGDVSSATPPAPVIPGDGKLGAGPVAMAVTPEGDYALVAHADDDPVTGGASLAVVNLKTGREVDCGPDPATAWGDTPATGGVDRIPLSHLSSLETGAKRYRLGKPAKIVAGPAGDRFYVLHTADDFAFEGDEPVYSGVTTVDLNRCETPEVTFHKLMDVSLVARDLKSNSINAVVVDCDGRVYAGTNGGGLSMSDDNGESWELQKVVKANGECERTILCLAAAKYRGADGRFVAVVLAGGPDGAWIKRGTAAWSRVGTAGETLSSAVALTDGGPAVGGLAAIGNSAGNVTCARDFRDDTTWSRTAGPTTDGINALAIDDAGRLWCGSDVGQYVNEGIFGSGTSAWEKRLPAGVAAAKVNALHIDRSRTYPAPWSKVLRRDAATKPSIPCAPSLYASPAGLHLFYLDDIDNGANGTTLASPRLWYVKSPDFGKTWKDPVLISSTPAGASKADWAHSALVDDRGVLQVVFRSNRSGAWRVYYQRSDDGGDNWLSADVDVNAAWPPSLSVAPVLDDLYYNNGGVADWIKFGADHFRQLAWSQDNRLYVVFSDSATPRHYLRWSPDGGRTWPADCVTVIPKDELSDLVESIDFIEPANRLMFMMMTGARIKRKLISMDATGSNVMVNNNFSNISYIYESNPPQYSDYKFNYRFKSIYTTTEQGDQFFVYNNTSNYPYDNFKDVNTQYDGNAIPPNVTCIYKSAFVDTDDYSLYCVGGVQTWNTLKKMLILNKSISNGKSFEYMNIFLDFIYNDYDYSTSIGYNSNVYIVKKSDIASPKNNFSLSVLQDEILFSAGNEKIYYLNPTMQQSGNENSTSSYTLSGENIKCISSDPSGNIVYGTEHGVFYRDVKRPRMLYWTSGYSAARLAYPPHLTGVASFRWHNYLKETTVNSIYSENNGKIWVSTDKDGIFVSNDNCTSWKNIKSINSKLNNILITLSGQSNKLEAINLISNRYNKIDSITLSNQTIGILNYTRINKLDYTNIGFQSQYNYNIVTNSCDSTKYYIYDSINKKIIIKTNDKSNINLLKTITNNYAASDFTESTHLNTGLNINTNDTVEIFSNGEYTLGYTNTNSSFMSRADGFYHQYEGSIRGYLGFSVGLYKLVCYQHYIGCPGVPGMLELFLNVNATPGNIGHCQVDTRVSSPPVTVDVSGKLSDTVDKLVAAPDGRTVYALDSTGRRAYALADITNPAALAVTRVPASGGLPSAPRNVIFSPKSAAGSFKTYLVCDGTIVDLAGNALFAGNYAIADAVCTDQDELYFVDRSTSKLYRVVRSNEKVVHVIVEESDDVVASMPPLVLAKKFYKSATGRGGTGFSPARDPLKYEFVYTSRDYPAGIPAGRIATWKRHDPAVAPGVARVFVVDSILAVDGTLEIAAGTVVKFATQDKRPSYAMAPTVPKAAACLVVGPTGRLVVSGGLAPADRVLFTSLDDVACAPSVWNAPDAAYRSVDGLPNLQLYRVKAGGDGAGGPRYGDWGAPGAGPFTAPNASLLAGRAGGILLANPARALISGLDLRYGLLSTVGLYPDGILPPNFDTPDGIPAWTRTNVWLVGAGGLRIGAQTRLDLGPGAIVRFDGGKGLRPETPAGAAYPRYGLLIDGAAAAPVVFRHAAGSAGSVTSAVTGRVESLEGPFFPSATLGPFNVFSATGEGDRSVVSRAVFPDGAQMSMELKGTGFRFHGCRFGDPDDPGGPAAGALRNPQSFSAGDATVFDACLIALANGGTFDAAGSSCVAFHDCSLLSYAVGGLTALPLFQAGGDATLRLEGNLLDHRAGAFPNSRVRIASAAIVRDNLFRNLDSANNVSCEVEIAGGATPAWPTVAGNRFENSKLALAVSGYAATSRILDDRIAGNAFVACDKIVRIATPGAGLGAGEFSGAGATASDGDGNLFVADPAGTPTAGAITKYGSNGAVLLRFGPGPFRDGSSLVDPSAIAVNATGEVYVVDRTQKRVFKFDPAGRLLLSFGTTGSSPGSLNGPVGIAVAATATSETLLVTDALRFKLVKFSNTGEYLEEIGSQGAALGQFDGPAGVAPTADGKFVYLADATNNRVVKVELEAAGVAADPSFAITTRVVDPATSTWIDGDSTPERLPLECTVTALKADGTVDPAYAPTADLALTIDPVPGPVLWAGTPVTNVIDPDPTSINNGGTLKKEAFTAGVATFYVAAFEACSERAIVVTDAAATPSRVGVARGRWTESTRHAGEKLTLTLNATPPLVTMTFCWIPQGTFVMGSPTGEPGRNADESPLHPVVVAKGFWMAETECTQAQWLAVPLVNNSMFTGDLDRPVEAVTWNQGRGFMTAMNGKGFGAGTFRFPSEAEWEYACRADAPTAFYWGTVYDNTYNTYCWNRANTFVPIAGTSTHPVGQKPPNSFGLHDMSGNVWEWCNDYFSGTYYSVSPVINPPGPSTGLTVVLRGGSHFYNVNSSRSAQRLEMGKGSAANEYGFRPVIMP